MTSSVVDSADAAARLTSGLSNSPAEDQSTVAHTEPEVKVNPEWNEALSAIPAEYHSKLTPVFQKWDNRYTELNTQYEPFKGIRPEEFQAMRNLVDNLNRDPRYVYDELGKMLGITKQEAEKLVEQTQQEEDVDPALKEIKQQQQRLEEEQKRTLSYIESQRQKEAQTTYEQQIDVKIKDIMSRDPGIDVHAVLERAAYILSTQGKFDIDKAYQEVKDYENTVIARYQAGKSNAPSVITPGGGMAKDVVNPSEMTTSQRTQLFISMRDAAANNRH